MDCIPNDWTKRVRNAWWDGMVLYSVDKAMTCQPHSVTDSSVPNEVSSYYKPFLEPGSIQPTPKRQTEYSARATPF